MPSLTVENYLKAILQIGQRVGNETVATGQLAEELEVSPGTVTSMLKTLAESKLARYTPYEGAALTEEGRTLALRMLRRHRLIELFLVETLGLSWDQVHEEAEHMEHAVSDGLVDAMDAYLGHPVADPHGDPIPTAEGEMRGTDIDAVPLPDCSVGTKIRLTRVTNQGGEFLRFLSETGLELGRVGTVVSNSPAAGLVTLDFDGQVVPLGHAAAAALLVERVQ
ncbi:MAG: metal-dependent transcriptional regulator [Planctomycetota bacterium]|nr:metal-dependent transcriptional regulator [Planctomycetaceae bacterium]MDQ3331389.1 metal-dependent transcriptional regulator [Planctomycetota bacterium]